MSFEDFFESYINTALWSSTDEICYKHEDCGIENLAMALQCGGDGDGGKPMDANFGPDDIAPESLNFMRHEAQRFYLANLSDLNTSSLQDSLPGQWHGLGGQDFWLTRNGHGAGFWDGDWDEPEATRLTNAAEAFGEVDLYVGEDGMIYQAGSEGWKSNPVGRKENPRGSDWRHLTRELSAKGWRVEPTHGGHIKMFSPDGKCIVVASSTPSDFRVLTKIKADLRRCGYREGEATVNPTGSILLPVAGIVAAGLLAAWIINKVTKKATTDEEPVSAQPPCPASAPFRRSDGTCSSVEYTVQPPVFQPTVQPHKPDPEAVYFIYCYWPNDGVSIPRMPMALDEVGKPPGSSTNYIESVSDYGISNNNVLTGARIGPFKGHEVDEALKDFCNTSKPHLRMVTDANDKILSVMKGTT